MKKLSKVFLFRNCLHVYIYIFCSVKSLVCNYALVQFFAHKWWINFTTSLLHFWITKLLHTLTNSTYHRYRFLFKYMKKFHVASKNLWNLNAINYYLLFQLLLNLFSINKQHKHVCTVQRCINAESSKYNHFHQLVYLRK